MKENYISIGRILRPQGIKGEVKIEPFTDDNRRFETLKSVDINGQSFEVSSVAVRQNGVFLSFKGVADRNAAEELRGKELSVLRTQAVKLPKDRYFIADLIGCTVVDNLGEVIGILSQIWQHGAADVYEIALKKGNIMFPALKSVLENVDILNKQIIVNRTAFEQVAVYND